jgi:hypothetical protein
LERGREKGELHTAYIDDSGSHNSPEHLGVVTLLVLLAEKVEQLAIDSSTVRQEERRSCAYQEEA